VGDVSLEREASGTWKVRQGGRDIATGLRFKERYFWKDVQKALTDIATSAPAPTEFAFKTSADVKAWMDGKIREYGSKNALLASDEYRRAYPFIKKVNDAERAVSKVTDAEAAETAMTQAGLKYDADRVYFPRGQKTVAWDTRWKKAT